MKREDVVILNIVESKKDIRTLFKKCGVKINLSSSIFRNNNIIDVIKINKMLEKECKEEFCLSEISKYDNILFICNNTDKLPSWIKEVQHVNGFILLGNLSKEFLNEITCFKQIKELLVLNAEIDMIPATIGEITELRDLYISDSKISNGILPDSIQGLKNLQSLVISGSTINNLPSTIGLLDSLQVLDISSTLIDILPDSIGNLRNLQTLNISDTMIKKLPDSISELNVLEHFYLYGLKIDKMPWFKNCIKGRETFCYKFDNYIPFSVLHQPISLFEQSPEIIQQYYDEEKEEINNYKVIFLGHGAAGKTHTIKRIKNQGKLQDYDTKQTEGISIYEEIFDYENERMTLSFWDFSGQDEMYSMHRCFLTERSCYVVVVSNRLHESLQEQAQYWLRNINIFAKGACVIIAINNSERTYSEGVDTELLRRQFPEILIGDSISYSAKCSPEDEFNRVVMAILKQIHNLDCYKMKFPKNWIGIINEIRNNQYNYISKKRYQEICQNNKVNSPSIRKWLLSWFHDLGYCFCNHINMETADELEDYQIINPNWITTAMYRINYARNTLNGNKTYVKEINFKKGTIAPSTLYFLINDTTLGGESIKYDLEEIDYILGVMRKFKLSYKISPSFEFVPSLCDYNKPVNLYVNDFDETLIYYIKYAYLPENIIHRLMISLYQNNFYLSTVWRCGFYLEINNPFVIEDSLCIVVEANYGNDMLELRISGKSAENRGQCLWKLLNIIYEINLSTNCKVVEEYVEKKKNKQIAHLPLSSIFKAKERGISEIWSTDGGEYESYSLNELVGETFGDRIYNNAIEIVKNNDIKACDAVIEARTYSNLFLNESKDDIPASINYNYYFNDAVYSVHGDNTSIHHNLDVNQMLSLMEEFLNLPSLSEGALDELQEVLGDENHELKEEMQQAKGNTEKRKSILAKAVECTKAAISTANDVQETVESGITTYENIVNTGKKIIKVTKPIITTLMKLVETANGMNHFL